MLKQEQLEQLIQECVAYVDRNEIDVPQLPKGVRNRPYGKYLDHSVLRAYTSAAIVRAFCKEARDYGAAAVSVNPVHIPLVAAELKGSGVKTGASIGFPLGATTTAVKAFETAEAIQNGAEEIDMVMNIGAIRDRNYTFACEDVMAVVDAAKGATVKAIIETCYLTRREKIAACVIAKEAGVDFIKTSTGMGTAGARVSDVILMRRAVKDSIGVKAAGDISTRADVDTMIEAGAKRMGISRLIQIVENDTSLHSAALDNQPPKTDELGNAKGY
jgi:deoxyribose-phosphate aldolase